MKWIKKWLVRFYNGLKDDLDTKFLEPISKLIYFKCPLCTGNMVNDQIKYLYIDEASHVQLTCECGEKKCINLNNLTTKVKLKIALNQ